MANLKNIKSGLYIVTLTNKHPISVNANDPRLAAKCIMVNRENCKFGKAKNLDTRKKNYEKVFGSEHVVFRPLALLMEIKAAEKAVLRNLDPFRMRGLTGRKNEWLERINPAEVIEIVYRVLKELEIEYQVIATT